MKMGKQEILTRVTLKKFRAALFALIMIGAVFVGLLGNVSATIFFQDDMESGIGGWTFDGFWHQVNSSAPFAPPWNISHSPDHSWWYGQDATGDYDNGFTNTGNLTSPVIDLTTAAIGNLTFWTWYETEGGTNYDQMWIQISEDAGPFIDEYQINPTSMGTWLEKSINITSHVGHNIQIRFYFDTADEIGNDYQGWYIDDLEVNDIPLPPTPTIEPPHSDYGLDNDGNGLFNYLVVNVTVNITVAGDYIIEGLLGVPAGPGIDDDTVFTFLNTGVQIVELQFEGWIIRNSFFDGPYDVELYLYDDSWNLLDSDIHNTGSYTYDQFDFPPATFEPPHSDYGLDTDGDGYFNYLVVNVTVNVSVAGDYIIEGTLTHPLVGWIDDDINFTFLNAGIQTVQLWFDGTSIYTSGADGGYDVELYLYDDSWNFLDFDMYTTSSYTYTQFQPPGAAFSPPYSDYGLDTDGDGYFNYLVVNVTVDVSVADAYRVQGWLYDISMITIDFDSNYTFLNTGIQVVQLYFDGISIYNWGVDGPYDVELELTDSLWNLLDTDWYTTGSYTYDQFQPPGAEFSPPYSDYGLDTDGDGYFNYLVVNVTVNVSVAGDYIIDSYLYDPLGSWIDDDTNFTFLNAGIQTVQLWFEGTSIYVNGANGGYDVELNLYDDSWNNLDFDMYTTSFYTYDQFQPPGAAFEPPYSDYGLDTDGDGYFNYLVVNVTVNVSVAGDYIIEGYLYDPMGPWIDYDNNFTFLNAGIQTVQLWFDGSSIYTSGADGGYDVELYLYDDSWNILDSDTYTTSLYTYDQFQPPAATFQPPYSDFGLDTDGDGYFNYLVVNVSVNIGVADFYEVYGELWGPMNWIDDYSNYTFLNTGVQIVQLYFEGSLIYNNGEDGPYTVYLDLYDDFSNWLDSDMYTTSLYTYDQFQPLGATFSPPYSDYGLDTDGDGFFNYLVVNVTVDVNIAGDYTVQAVLLDSLFNLIEFIDNTTFLNTGVQVVQFYFSGPAIYSHGMDGPYMVFLELYDSMMNSLDTDMYTTNVYTFSQFQAGGAVFNPPHSDYGLDTDGDGFFNYMIVNVSVNVMVAGDYTVEGTLFDPLFNPIDFNANFTFLNTGIQVVQLYFDGITIFNNGEDGTFSVYLELFDNLSTLIDTDLYTTTFYTHVQFQRPASLQPPYSDYGLDTDGDGFFNYLVVNVTVNVSIAGDYEVFGELYNASMVSIGSSSNFTFLNTGLQVVQLYFDGMSIYNNGEDGTYTVWLDLYDDSMNWLDTDMYITSIYTYDQFQPPPVNPWATATGPVSAGTNDPSPTITYNYGNSPTNVQIYWSNDGGLSWNMWGTDNSVDGSWPAGSPLPASGTYYWSARAMGGPSEPAPSGPADIEAGSYVLDLDAPWVVSTNPVNGDTGVPVNQDIVITFNETMDTTSFIYTIEPNPGGLSEVWSGVDTIVTISHTDFAMGTRYWVNITAVTDLAGNDLNPLPYSFYFDTTTAATTATATGPVGGPTNVAGITITYTTSGGPASADLWYTTDTSSPYTWNFIGTDSPADGSYPWTVPADGSYGWFANSTDQPAPTSLDIPEASYYIYDSTQPEVVSTVPANGDTGVLVNQDVVITFNETMIPGTFTYTIEPNPGGLSEVWSGGDTIVTISHTDFAMGTRYWVNITAITDLAGNNLNPLPYSFYFDTVTPGTTATATGPVGGPTNVAGITITYSTTGGPASVDLYYTTDTVSPYTWNLIGTDTPADGNYPWTVPADGSYGWFIVSPDETAPTSLDLPEASYYIYDSTQPEVLSTNPANATPGIPVTQDIVITFNETMVPGTFTYTIEPNPGGLSEVWSGGDTIVTISHTDFAMGTRYWVNITAVTDLAGNDLNPLPYSFYFDTTTLATTATATGPVGGPTNVAGITITYTTGGIPASVDLYYTTELSAPYTWTLIGTDTPADGNYPWTVPADGSYGWFAKSPDEAVPLSSDSPEASYYIYDGTSPVVVSTIPVNAITGVLVDQDIVITFNETMVPGTFTYTIEPNPGGLSEVWSGGDTIVTISHTDFALGTRYWVNITAVTDLAGNSLDTLPYSFYFDTTIFATTATVTGPVGGPTNVAGITITYTTTGNPTTIDLYYTTNTVSPYTWTLIGTDSPADGTYSWTVPTGGSYGWFAKSPDEAAPTSSDTPEASYYIYDGIVPTSEVSSIPAYRTSLSFDVTYTAQDNLGGSGVKEVELWYQKDGGTWTLYNTYTGGSRTVTFTADSDGEYNFYTRARDNANNYENAPTSPDADTTVDTTPPTVDAGPDMTDNSEFTQDASASDDGSGIATYEWTQESGPGTITFGDDAAEDTTVSADTDGTYVIRLTVTDLAGNSDYDEFTLVWDTTSPTVTTTTPTGTDVSVTSTITITFNEAMNHASVQNAFNFTDGTTVWTIANGSVSWAGNVMTFTPTTDLSYGTSYTVNIGTGAQDQVGNGLATVYTWSFTTVQAPDTTAPTVSSVSLTGTKVVVTNMMSITFDEPMDHASVEDAITISPDVEIINYSWVGNTLTITFETDLEYGTEYTVTIGTGAEDEAGNAIEEPYTWQFTTKEEEEEAEFPLWIIALIVIIIIVILLILFLMKGKRKPEGLPEEKVAEAEIEGKPEEELVEEPGITEGEGLEAEEEIGAETGEGEVEKSEGEIEKQLEEMAEEEKKESEEL